MHELLLESIPLVSIENLFTNFIKWINENPLFYPPIHHEIIQMNDNNYFLATQHLQYLEIIQFVVQFVCTKCAQINH